MVNLKAVLRGDLYTARGVVPFVAGYALLGVALTVAYPSAGIAWLYTVVLVMLPTSVVPTFFAGDDAPSGLLLSSLPTTRRTVVASGFILSGAFVAAVQLVLGLVLALTPVGEGASIGWLGFALLALPAALFAVMPPAQARFGRRSVFFVLLAIFGCMVLAALGVVWALPGRGDSLEGVLQAAAARPAIIVVGAWAVVAVAWVVSYLVTVRVFEAKDF